MTTGRDGTADARIQEVLDQITDGIFSLDRDWNYTFINRAGATLVGRTVEELIGRNIWEEFPEVIGTDFERCYRGALESQQPAVLEQRYEPLGRWYSVQVYPWEKGLTILYQDVTERERAREEISERARQQSALAVLAQRCLLEPSLEGMLTEATASVAETLGALRVEIWGQADADSAPSLRGSAGELDPDRHGDLEPLRVAIPGGGAGVTELAIYTEMPLVPDQNVKDFLTAVVALLSTGARRISVLREVEFMALHEPVTGLPNRHMLLRHLERILETADPATPAPAVIAVSVDRMWLITNSYGHRTADDLIIVLTDRIRRVAEPHSMLAQLGSDLFVLVMHQPTSDAEPVELAERLHAVMHDSLRTESGEHFLTLTVGITRATKSSTPVELLRESETALRQARGPKRTAVFDEAAHEATVRRANLDRELHGALERRELSVYYQPIVDLRSGAARGIEALVRWTPADGEVIPPIAFIDAAEDNGLIVPIGEWVLRRACRDAAELQRDFSAQLGVSVNVSARQLADPDFPDTVERVVVGSGLRPGTLELELTESVLLEEAEQAENVLDALKQRGIRVALDDFGSGYSSLSYLRRLPVDTLKVDRSFVSDLTRRTDTAIVEAIVKMAHAMGMVVVAEGVEHVEQAELLDQLGCDRLQGYLYQQPVPIDELRRHLRV